MACLCCGSAAEIGALCRHCALEIAPCEGLIPDHIRSSLETAEAVAWIVDGFGGAHAIATKATIGRNHGGDVVVLASSVSREHAEIALGSAGWTARDLGSRNGTFVDGVRCAGRTALADRATIKVGDVALWFLARVAHEPAQVPPMATGAAGEGLVRYQLMHGGVELCVVGGDDPASGGALLSRAVGGDAWSERGLAPLEFQLLRALCARAHLEAASPSLVRGCVSTRQLARELPFQSRFANEENVRQVVRRLRSVLGEVGADGILSVSPGRGYYVAGSVTVAGSPR